MLLYHGGKNLSVKIKKTWSEQRIINLIQLRKNRQKRANKKQEPKHKDQETEIYQY